MKKKHDGVWRRSKIIEISIRRGRNIEPKLFRKLRSVRVCNRCQMSSDFLEIDHIIPVSKGGGNGKRNLQVLCHSCHLKKNLAEKDGE